MSARRRQRCGTPAIHNARQLLDRNPRRESIFQFCPCAKRLGSLVVEGFRKQNQQGISATRDTREGYPQRDIRKGYEGVFARKLRKDGNPESCCVSRRQEAATNETKNNGGTRRTSAKGFSIFFSPFFSRAGNGGVRKPLTEARRNQIRATDGVFKIG